MVCAMPPRNEVQQPVTSAGDAPVAAESPEPQRLDATQARDLTDRIKESAETLWSLLLEAYEGKAWAALDYGSWREYIASEFDMDRSRSYQLIDQGKVIRALTEAGGVSTSVDIPEATARRLKPHLGDAVAEVREAVEGGAEPIEAVRTAIEKHGGLPPGQADELAKEHRLRVPATDGSIHDSVERDERAINEHLENTFSVFNALEAMATHRLTPAALIAAIPSYQDYRINEHLEPAFEWLTAFRKEWRGRDDLQRPD